MIGRALPALSLGVLGLLGLAALSLWAAQTVWPSYLAAWLAVSALPLGALTLVMGRDLFARPETPLSAILRAMLPAMPLVALFAVPMLTGREHFYGLPDLRQNPVAATWMGPHATLGRGVAILILWLVLALVFRRPPAVPGRRTGLAVAGLCLQLVVGTLAAVDWVAAVDRNLASSSLGLTLLVAQAGAALALASALAPRPQGDRHMPPGSIGLMILFGVWLFLQFAQYLVVWSANLPAEAVWYLRRGGALGIGAEIAAFVVMAVGLMGFVPMLGPRLVRAFEILVLVVIVASMYWLVVPASRGEVSLTLSDGLALVGLGGLLGGAALMFWRGFSKVEAAHGRV